jgi:dipeptidyl-peptidase 4
MPCGRTILTAFSLIVCVVSSDAADRPKVTGANWPLAQKFTREFVAQHVQEASIAPVFIGKSDVFWYAVRHPEGTKYWKVDPDAKTKVPLFDQVTFLAQLSELSKKPIDAVTSSLRDIKVADDGKSLKFSFGTLQYEYDLVAATMKKLGNAPPPEGQFGPPGGRGGQRQQEEKKEEEKKDDEKKEDQIKKDDEKKDVQPPPPPTNRGGDNGYQVYSPDRKKYVYTYKYNLYLAEEGKESEAKQLSTDGEEDYGYGGFGGGTSRTVGEIQKPQPPSERKTRPNVTWSKDSKKFTVNRQDRRGVKELFLVDSIAEPRPALERYRYAMPGEENISKSELYIGDAEAKTLTKMKMKWKDESYSSTRFGKTSDELEFIRRDRLLRNVEICRLNLKTNEEKCLISEGFDAGYLDFQAPRYIEETDEMIWWSERTGWGHLYLYDINGKLKNAITTGEWRVSRIVDVDVKNRLLYIQGNAKEPNENVYYNHLYRIRFDGSDLTLLTPGDANHRFNLSPSKKYVVDSYSRIDLAPAAVLRDDKGGELMKLEATNMTRLNATGWKMPETFNVKAADGMTDLYGNMWKPFDFDPSKQYPIIVYVYPGPQTEGVNHTFSAYSTFQQMAQLGFIVIQVGHRGGTPERSKAYHSFGYFNLRDYALIDKKAAIEALAARHPWIDIERVGIYGHSGGGFMSAAAMLQKPYNEFFKAAVASAGNHDNNIYNNSWSERYHGMKEVPVVATTGTTTTGQGTQQVTGQRGQGQGQGGRRPPPDEDDEPETEPQAASTTASDGIKKKLDALKSRLDAAMAKKDVDQAEIKKITQEIESLMKEVDEAKKSLTKTDDKKVEEKNTEDKKDMVKEGEKKDPPKTKFEIRVPTNAELADNLKGHLMLVHGEIDNNVHPANTMRLVDALIKANKRFDMLIIPGSRHGFGIAQPYFTDRMWDFFAEHLLNDRQTNANSKERVPMKK